MLTYTYVDKGKFALIEKEKPTIIEPTDAIVKVTLASICSSDIHIKHGAVPRAVKGITVGHEMVGIVEETGSAVTNVNVGDRVTVNVETFCGECFFCKNGYVNNCTDKNGGWALGCRIDGGQAEYVRVPLANTGLNKIPDAVSDEQALLVGDVLATGYWAARISEITEDDTVLIIGAYSLCYGWVPFSLEIDQTFIGAILTAIGYSINDKVVIFDRIREFFGLYPKRNRLQLFNDSLNTTLARTINTSLSTLIVLLCIFVLGGDSIRSFAFAMILGVVIGTLTSLFIAAPVAYLTLGNKMPEEEAKA